MRFLLNMNVNRDMTAQLEKRGHVCRHVGDMGMNRATDAEIVLGAKRAGEVMFHLDAVWQEIESALMKGAIISLSDKSLRIRRLPIEAE